MALKPDRDSSVSYRDRKWQEKLSRQVSPADINSIYSKPFVTISGDSELTSERILTGSSNIKITDNGANLSVVIDLTDTGVSAGSYVNSNITVDEKGRITNISSGSSSGEANTASNIGVDGVGVFDNKTGVDLQFRNISSGSGKVTVVLDSVNKTIDIDIDESKLSLGRSFLFMGA